MEQNLRDVPRGVIEMSSGPAASGTDMVFKVLLSEALPALVGSLTVTATGFNLLTRLSPARWAQVVWAIWRYATVAPLAKPRDDLVLCIVIMFVLVQATPESPWLAQASAWTIDDARLPGLPFVSNPWS